MRTRGDAVWAVVLAGICAWLAWPNPERFQKISWPISATMEGGESLRAEGCNLDGCIAKFEMEERGAIVCSPCDC